MTRVAVIGAGQTGAAMALALLKQGIEVSLYSDRTPQSLYENTPPTGTAVMYGEAIAVERRLGLATYEDLAPPITGLSGYVLPTAGVELMAFSGSLGDNAGVGVDTRIRSFDRMNELIREGGRLVVDEVTPDTLDEVAREHDLTFVATGKGGLSGLFARDEDRSGYSEPQRSLALITVTGVPVDESMFRGRSAAGGRYNAFTIVGDLGETIWCPFLHKTAGPSWSFLGFARSGTEWEERFSRPTNADEMLAVVKNLHQDYLPWDWEDVRHMEVIREDRHSWLKGRVLPSIRASVGHTTGGRPVMSLGDTSIALDPIGAQGAQSGIKQVGHYVDAIATHEGPFDEAWMNLTFEDYYARFGRASNLMTRMFLDQAAGGQVNETLITAANGDERAASALFGLLAAPQAALPLQDNDEALAWISRACDGEDPQQVLARAAARIEKAQALQQDGQPYFPRPTAAATIEVASV